MKSPKSKELFAFLPNLITLFNLFSGFLSIVVASQGNFLLASWLIVLSLVWDSLDGNIARMFKNTSTLGKELDSLSDIVSFVVAPIFLISKFFLVESSAQILFLLFFYLAAGAYRLVRFNIHTGMKNSFVGLPTPSAAMMIVMSVLACLRNQWVGDSFFMPLGICLVIILSFLMVSKVRYPKLNALLHVKWQSFLAGILLEAALVSYYVNVETALASVMLIFIFFAPIYHSFFWVLADGPCESES